MHAVISGRAGVAIVVEGDRLSSISACEPHVSVPRRADEVPLLLGEAQDLRFLEDISVDEVRRHLEEDTSAEESLHLALILLDTDHTNDLREKAADVLDKLLASDVVAERLERVLWARPMLPEMDRQGALAIARRLDADAVVKLLNKEAAVTLFAPAPSPIAPSVFGPASMATPVSDLPSPTVFSPSLFTRASRRAGCQVNVHAKQRVAAPRHVKLSTVLGASAVAIDYETLNGDVGVPILGPPALLGERALHSQPQRIVDEPLPTKKDVVQMRRWAQRSMPMLDAIIQYLGAGKRTRGDRAARREAPAIQRAWATFAFVIREARDDFELIVESPTEGLRFSQAGMTLSPENTSEQQRRGKSHTILVQFPDGSEGTLKLRISKDKRHVFVVPKDVEIRGELLDGDKIEIRGESEQRVDLHVRSAHEPQRK